MTVTRHLVRTFALLISLCLPATAASIRVGVLRASQPDTVSISCQSGMTLTDQSGKRTTLNTPNPIKIATLGHWVELSPIGSQYLSFTVQSKSGMPITLKSSRSSSRFHGRLRFSSKRGRLLIVNEVSLEDYVRGVVANEMRREWPTEALKAQAVIARTLAVQRLASHRSDGFDICDTTHCQIYRGALTETPTTDTAVRSTTGQILTWHGEPIQALYSSCCGGITAAAYASTSLGDTPYMKVTKDLLNGASACKESPHFTWSYSIPGADLAAALQSDSLTNPGAHLRDVRVIRTDASGRAVFVSVKGDRSPELDAYVLWNILCRRLGWGTIKSTRFTLVKTGGTYQFQGHGLGHGIGMCQWGANKRAKCHWSYSRILAFYYPGTKISQVRNQKSARNP